MAHHQTHPWAEPENAADMNDQQKELERLKLETLTAFDKQFYGVENVRGDGSNLDKDMLFSLMIGANVLAAQDLLDTGCKCVALMLKGRSPEQIRLLFNITNDFSCVFCALHEEVKASPRGGGGGRSSRREGEKGHGLTQSSEAEEKQVRRENEWAEEAS